MTSTIPFNSPHQNQIAARITPEAESIEPATLSQFLALHDKVTELVLKGRAVNIGNNHDIDWTFARGELIIEWKSPSGVTIRSVQQLTKHGARWRQVRPYLYAVIIVALVAFLFWNGAALLEQVGKLLAMGLNP